MATDVTKLIKPLSKEIKIRYDFLHLPFNHSDTFQFIREQLKYMAGTPSTCKPTLLEKDTSHQWSFNFATEKPKREQEHLTNSTCPLLMHEVHVLLRPNRADLDISRWTQE